MRDFRVNNFFFLKSRILIFIFTGENKGIPSCTLSRLTCDTFLRDALLNKQMRIEIWAQGSKGQWKLVKNVGSDLLFLLHNIFHIH